MDTTERLREKLERARAVAAEINDLETRLKALKAERSTLLGTDFTPSEVVDLMDQIGVDEFSLLPRGNYPGYDVSVETVFQATFPKDPEKVHQAIEVLLRHGQQDLIKTGFTIQFGKGEHAEADRLHQLLEKNKVEFERSDGCVNTGTMKAFIRKRFKSGSPLATDEMEALGANAGRVVIMKQKET